MMSDNPRSSVTFRQAVHGWIILQLGVPVLKPAGRHAGNKVWYTTMGAKDIIGHAISASAGSLPSKIRVGLSPCSRSLIAATSLPI